MVAAGGAFEFNCVTAVVDVSPENANNRGIEIDSMAREKVLGAFLSDKTLQIKNGSGTKHTQPRCANLIDEAQLFRAVNSLGTVPTSLLASEKRPHPSKHISQRKGRANSPGARHDQGYRQAALYPASSTR